jgi:hydrogenase expression/formation protein HypD
MNDLIKKETEFLKTYAGRELRIMEICGSHTAAITKSGLRAAVSEKIKLISGPGCPVCVTPVGFIDEAIMLALEHDCTIMTL